MSIGDKIRSLGIPKIPDSTTTRHATYEAPPLMGFDPPMRAEADFAPRNTRRMRLGEAAARAAQDVCDLQDEVEQLRAEVSMLRSTISVLEESNKLLHEEADHLRRENERLVRENTAIGVRISVAASILLELRKPVETQDELATQEAPLNSASEQEAPSSEPRPLGGEAPTHYSRDQLRL